MPITSTCIASSAVRAAPISVPTSIRPVVSIVTWHMIGSEHARPGHRAPCAVDRGLRLQQVVHRLDQQDVDTARDQPVDLRLVAVAQFRVADVPERRQLRARADRADHEPGPVGRRVRGRHLLGDRGRPLVDLERLLGDLVLAEHQRERAERGRLDGVDPGVEVLGVHLRHEVGAREDEHLVAPLERGPAEVVGTEVVGLHPRPERTVEHEHPLAQRVEERVVRAAADGTAGSPGIGHRARVRGRGAPAGADSRALRAPRSRLSGSLRRGGGAARP
ncbi:MAG: hypothetical protein KatS3mg009_3310 [Acidimicrobiia bacterium]|nr:MAG: hypothetical protein KatS3mg009_3310 [Acidimicrobiia bacterium]